MVKDVGRFKYGGNYNRKKFKRLIARFITVTLEVAGYEKTYRKGEERQKNWRIFFTSNYFFWWGDTLICSVHTYHFAVNWKCSIKINLNKWLLGWIKPNLCFQFLADNIIAITIALFFVIEKNNDLQYAATIICFTVKT